MKQYIGISRDHSGSMATLRTAAMKDYNQNIEGIKQGAHDSDIDTIVSVIECGVDMPMPHTSYAAKVGGGGYSYYGSQATYRFVVQNSSVNSLKQLTSYAANGSSTPLFDSLGELIESLEKVPDAKNEDVSFLVLAVTDGIENSSKNWDATRLGKKIKELQSTDRWTFALRVPRGFKYTLVRNLGIPEGNVFEWEQTERDLERSTVATMGATQNYYAARAKGVRGSTRFYSDLHNVKVADVAKTLDEIKGYRVFKVKDKEQIRPFVESKLGKNKEMKMGAAFYQLTKPEKIQGHKRICIRHKFSGKVFEGDNARKLLGIPAGGEVKVYPGNHGDYDVFVQSTSTNRNVLPDTEVLYWEGA